MSTLYQIVPHGVSSVELLRHAIGATAHAQRLEDPLAKKSAELQAAHGFDHKAQDRVSRVRVPNRGTRSEAHRPLA
jgi:hypothetical protein